MKILVRSPNWLGDCVMSTIFLSRLKKQNFDASITVYTKPHLVSLFEMHPSVSSVITTLGKNQFDIAYILPRSFRSAWELFQAKIPKRIGFPGQFRRLLLTKSVPFPGTLHYICQYLKLLGEENNFSNADLPFFPKGESSVKDLENTTKPLLGLAPVSNAPARTWAAERFVAVAKQFCKVKKGTVVLFGAPSEKDVIDGIAKQIPGSINMAGKLDFPQLGWALSQLDVLVANESGLMHAASAFKIPTIVLSGPSDTTKTTPPYPFVEVIQHKEISCVPCVKNECPRFGQYNKECMKAITPQEVTQRVHAKLS